MAMGKLTVQAFKNLLMYSLSIPVLTKVIIKVIKRLIKNPIIKTNKNCEYFFENIINYLEWAFLKHSTVLLSKHAMVMGPTPPGTGVIALATLATSLKSTSPTIPESVLLIPTSITIAPFFTQSPLTNLGIPTAAIIISALRHSVFKFLVFECVIVTVQFSFKSNCVIGFPGGAFYAFPKVIGTGMNGEEFAKKSLHEAGVAIVPGTSFGKTSGDYVRFSFAASKENISKAIEKIDKMLR